MLEVNGILPLRYTDFSSTTLSSIIFALSKGGWHPGIPGRDFIIFAPSKGGWHPGIPGRDFIDDATASPHSDALWRKNYPAESVQKARYQYTGKFRGMSLWQYTKDPDCMMLIYT